MRRARRRSRGAPGAEGAAEARGARGGWTFAPAAPPRLPGLLIACLSAHGNALPCVDAWCAAHAAGRRVRILARLRFGARVPSERKMDRLLADLSRRAAARYEDVTVAHLLGDRENERTLSMVLPAAPAGRQKSELS